MAAAPSQDAMDIDVHTYSKNRDSFWDDRPVCALLRNFTHDYMIEHDDRRNVQIWCYNANKEAYKAAGQNMFFDYIRIYECPSTRLCLKDYIRAMSDVVTTCNILYSSLVSLVDNSADNPSPWKGKRISVVLSVLASLDDMQYETHKMSLTSAKTDDDDEGDVAMEADMEIAKSTHGSLKRTCEEAELDQTLDGGIVVLGYAKIPLEHGFADRMSGFFVRMLTYPTERLTPTRYISDVRAVWFGIRFVEG